MTRDDEFENEGLGPEPGYPEDLQEELLQLPPAAAPDGMYRRGSAAANMLDGAVGRTAVRSFDDATAQVEEAFLNFVGSGDGHIFIERIGPLTLPRTELGHLGKLRVSDLAAKPLAETIQRTWGGGTYRITARRPDNTVVAGVAHELDVAGDSVYVSKSNRPPSTGTGSDPFDALERAMALTRRIEPPMGAPADSGATSLALMVQMMSSMNDAAAAREVSKVQMEIELMRARGDAERAERDERRRRDEEENTRRQKMFERESAERMARMEALNRQDMDRAQRGFDNERERILASAHGGLGVEGVKKVREALADLVASEAKSTVASLGQKGDEEEEESWSDVAKGMLREVGPDLVRKFVTKSPATPAATTDDEDEEERAISSEPAPKALPAGTPEVPYEERLRRKAIQQIHGNLKAFYGTVGVLAVSMSDPGAAPYVNCDDGRPLELVWGLLPMGVRSELELDFVAGTAKFAFEEAAFVAGHAKENPEWYAELLEALASDGDEDQDDDDEDTDDDPGADEGDAPEDPPEQAAQTEDAEKEHAAA